MSRLSPTDGRITRADVLTRLDYDSKTGIFTWKHDGKTYAAGDKAGTHDNKGYVRISIKSTQFPAHRIAWLYHYEEWPSLQIDHINGVKDDNRISNLRLASNSQNNAAKSITKVNTSGAKGVSWNSRKSKWQVYIGINGKNKNLGYYDDIEKAKIAYNVAAKLIYGPFANAGKVS